MEEAKRILRAKGARLPPTLKLAANFAKAVVKHAMDGFTKVPPEEYARRLSVCNECSLRMTNRCTHPDCGCYLDKKAWWASESCPMEKWGIYADGVEIKGEEPPPSGLSE